LLVKVLLAVNHPKLVNQFMACSEITVAETGDVVYREAVPKAIELEKPDVLVLSAFLEGAISYREIIFFARQNNVRVIFLAGSLDEDDPLLSEVVKLGVYDIVFNPATFGKILNHIQNAAPFSAVSGFLKDSDQVELLEPEKHQANGDVETESQQQKAGLSGILGKIKKFSLGWGRMKQNNLKDSEKTVDVVNDAAEGDDGKELVANGDKDAAGKEAVTVSEEAVEKETVPVSKEVVEEEAIETKAFPGSEVVTGAESIFGEAVEAETVPGDEETPGHDIFSNGEEVAGHDIFANGEEASDHDIFSDREEVEGGDVFPESEEVADGEAVPLDEEPVDGEDLPVSEEAAAQKAAPDGEKAGEHEVFPDVHVEGEDTIIEHRKQYYQPSLLEKKARRKEEPERRSLVDAIKKNIFGKKRPFVVSCWSPASTGKTFVSVNLAAVAAMQERVMLIDLDLQERAVYTWLNIFADDEPVYPLLMGEAVKGISSNGFSVFGADPNKAGKVFAVPYDFISNLPEGFDFVVIDLPRVLDESLFHNVLLESDAVLLVADPDFHHCLRLQRSLKGFPEYILVANKFTFVKAPFSYNDLFGKEPAVKIPILPGVYDSILYGKPLVASNPDASKLFSALYRKLAQVKMNGGIVKAGVWDEAADAAT